MTATQTLETVDTDTLRIGFLRSGPQSGRVAVLLHGWPDAPATWAGVLPALHQAGWQTLSPYLRGYGPTRFRSASTMRSGQLSALGQDVLDFADALALQRFAVIGHDWGARAAYIASCVAPERISHCAALSVGWGTNDPDQDLSLRQVQNYWYHWYMALERGAALVRDERRALTRHIWDIWNPGWTISDAEFDATARAFDNPDWAEVVVHSYRVRWGLAPRDPAFDALEDRLRADPTIAVPTLMLHGGADPCNEPATSAGRASLFSGPYRRDIIDGAGHFPQRDSAATVAAALQAFLSA